jgi:hypothetical protein
MSLDRFEAAAQLSIAGRSSQPLTLRTRPPSTVTEAGLAVLARAASRERYGRQVELIDRELETALAPRGATVTTTQPETVPEFGAGRQTPW